MRKEKYERWNDRELQTVRLKEQIWLRIRETERNRRMNNVRGIRTVRDRVSCEKIKRDRNEQNQVGRGEALFIMVKRTNEKIRKNCEREERKNKRERHKDSRKVIVMLAEKAESGEEGWSWTIKNKKRKK